MSLYSATIKAVTKSYFKKQLFIYRRHPRRHQNVYLFI